MCGLAGDPSPAAGQHDAACNHHGDPQAHLLGPGQGHALCSQGNLRIFYCHVFIYFVTTME